LTALSACLNGHLQLRMILSLGYEIGLFSTVFGCSSRVLVFPIDFHAFPSLLIFHTSFSLMTSCRLFPIGIFSHL
jgi:hypothetical protein